MYVNIYCQGFQKKENIDNKTNEIFQQHIRKKKSINYNLFDSIELASE